MEVHSNIDSIVPYSVTIGNEQRLRLWNALPFDKRRFKIPAGEHRVSDHIVKNGLVYVRLFVSETGLSYQCKIQHHYGVL